jgi:hypothetical protein
MDYVRFEGEEKILIERIGLGGESRLLAANDFLTIHYSANAMQLFDRNKVPLRWLETIPAMEDVMFSVCAYGHVPYIYHVNDVLHDYVQTPDSFSTNADATKNFAAAKLIVIGQLERGEVSFLQERDRLAVLEYFTLSHIAEGLYAEEQAAGGLLSFTEIFSRLRQEKSTSPQAFVQ